MLRMITSAMAACLLGGCGCSEVEMVGEAEADIDAAPEVVPDDPAWDSPADDHMPDIHHDALDVPMADGTECVPATVGGECNVIEQCGCEDHPCSIGVFYVGPPENWDVIEYCGYGVPHPIAIGDVCDPMRFPDPQCEPSAACYSGGGGAGHCLQWCLTDSDCSNPGAECSVTLLHWFRYDIFDPEFPYIFCSR